MPAFDQNMDENTRCSFSTESQKYLTKQDRKLGKKLTKSRHLLLKHENIKPSYHPTRHLFVANGGLLNQIQRHEIVDLFGQYTGMEQVFMIPGKPYCFISFTESTYAEEACKNLQAFELHSKPGPERVIIYLLYINQVPEHVKNVPDTSNFPPGLHLITDFIDEATEQHLLDSLQWEANTCDAEQVLKQRQVQHYGYKFCYDTNDVDRKNPIPGGLGSPLFQGVADKILASNLVKHPLDQLTINQYYPGQGIPSHVDTHSAFEDGFCSLSLGSQVVMLFTHPNGCQIPVILPARSLLILSGEARYLWSHGIVARKSDVIPAKDASSEGALTVVPRGIRTSFTYRSVKWTPCKCNFPERCDSQGYVKNSVATITDCKGKTPVKLPTTELEASRLEANHVHTVYDNIAPHFSETRYKAWPPVVEFLDKIPPGSIVLDVGCGNGKYLGINSEIFKFGCDRSRNLVGICREKSHEAFVCDSLLLPIRSGSLDVCICVAVLHHFTTVERRLQGLMEIVRVLRHGGRALVTVWALEQEKNKKKSTYLKKTKESTMHSSEIDRKGDNENVETSSKSDLGIASLNITSQTRSSASESANLNVHSNRTQFKEQDMLVPWHFKKPGEKVMNEKNFEVYHRFYHVFMEGELQTLCRKLPGVTIEKCYYVEGNWFIIFHKNS